MTSISLATKTPQAPFLQQRSTFCRCTFIALIVLAIAASTLLALGATHFFGSITSVGFIASMSVASGALAISIVGLMILGCTRCKKNEKTVENKNPFEQGRQQLRELGYTSFDYVALGRILEHSDLPATHREAIEAYRQLVIDDIPDDEEGVFSEDTQTAHDLRAATNDLSRCRKLVEKQQKILKDAGFTSNNYSYSFLQRYLKRSIKTQEIQHYLSILNTPDNVGKTLLHLAHRHKNNAVVAYLEKNGVNPDALDMQGKDARGNQIEKLK